MATYRKFEFTRVAHRAGGAIARNGRAFILLSIIISGSAALLTGVGQIEDLLDTGGPFGPWRVIGGLVSAIAGAVLQVSITRATILDAAGRRADLGECLAQGLRLLLPVVGLTIVYSFGVGLASLLLIVPGIIVAVMWTVAVPAFVEERAGVFASLARSRALTKGARWPIFGMLLLYVLAILALAGVQGTIMLAFASFQIAGLLLNAVGSALIAMIWSVVTAAIYIELRETKEGIGTAQLAEIFA